MASISNRNVNTALVAQRSAAELIQDKKVVVSTDIGFDADDFLALTYRKLYAVVTALHNPVIKSGIARAVLHLRAEDLEAAANEIEEDIVGSQDALKVVAGVAPVGSAALALYQAEKLTKLMGHDNKDLKLDEAAELRKTAANAKNVAETKVFSGIGYYPDDKSTSDKKTESFLEMFPRWPVNAFGNPGEPGMDPIEAYGRANDLIENIQAKQKESENLKKEERTSEAETIDSQVEEMKAEVRGMYPCVYSAQEKPYKDLASYDVSSSVQNEQLVELLEGLEDGEKVNVLSIGPLSNEAYLLERCPNKINAFVMMNGTFMNKQRLGYNGVLNLSNTNTVFNSGIPCIIATSDLCQGFRVSRHVIDAILQKKEKGELTHLGEHLLETLRNWEAHFALKRGLRKGDEPINIDLHNTTIADLIARIVLEHPELVAEMQRVKYTFNPDADKSIHMLDPRANELYTREEISDDDGEKSRVYEVTSFKDNDSVQKIIDEHVFDLFCGPKATI